LSYIQFPNPTPVFPVLPPLTWSLHKKAHMASRVTTAITGRENQLACAAYPRWEFLLSYGGESWLRDQTQNIAIAQAVAGLTELTQISQLFLACLGQYGEFYFSDPDDNSRDNQAEGTGNGTQTTFALYYTWGFGPFTPSFTAPVGGIQILNTVYIDGVPQSASTYALDSTNTMLVFTSAPAVGAVITADFTFYYRCHFLADEMTYSQWAANLWEVKEVKFESVKP
jgi:uncharacterized protein (TIGR02217 family)